MEPKYCMECERELNPNRIVWLELNMYSGNFHKEEGEIPEEESQGWFPFGSDCAKKLLNENKECEKK